MSNRSGPGAARRASAPQMFAWTVYDWASNAYATIVLTFVFAPYFSRAVVQDETAGTVLWGVMLGVAGIFIAVGAPVIGATMDHAGRRKPWLAGFTLLSVAATAMLWWVRPDPGYVWLALVVVALGELGIEYSHVLYNAMLPALVPRERLGRWSGRGWSMGYAGGLACLVLALFVFVREDNPWIELDREQAQHVRATFLLAAAWFLIFSVPLFLFTPDEPRSGKPLKQAARDGLRQLRDTFREVRKYSNIVRFLIARIIYIDGLATLFVFGGMYATQTFEMNEQEVLTFGIAINVAAGLGAIGFSWIDDWIGGRRTILISLVGLTVPGTFLLLVETDALFWTFGLILGVFVGPVQAASRSLLSRLAPEHLRNQMFGLYAFSGKVAFLCSLLVGLLTWLTGVQRIGMSMIVVFFVTGFLLMLTVREEAA